MVASPRRLDAGAPRLRFRAARVLALYVATFLVTLLAPLAQGQAYERLCSARGDRYVAVDAQGMPMDGGAADHAARCALCLPAAAPPPVFAWTPEPDRPVATPLAVVARAPDTARVGAPFPPRAPPRIA